VIPTEASWSSCRTSDPRPDGRTGRPSLLTDELVARAAELRPDAIASRRSPPSSQSRKGRHSTRSRSLGRGAARRGRPRLERVGARPVRGRVAAADAAGLDANPQDLRRSFATIAARRTPDRAETALHSEPKLAPA
jgi:hypothetical protein